MTFRVGQKVVCVNAAPWKGFDPKIYDDRMDGLQEDCIYTVRQVTKSKFIGVSYVGIRVIGIRRPMGDRAYCASRFRPIVQRKTDISAFHEILRKASPKETVRA